MALRNVLTKGDETLNKTCRPVKKFDAHLHQLLDDMADTLAEQDGVGLAAPQVGILKRAVIVIETNVDEDEEEYIIELINPEIVRTEGEQRGTEGCLSIPNEFGIVTRPEFVTVRAQDRDGEWFEYDAEGLTARCFCHEIDHLNGILFDSRAERMLTPEEMEKMAQERAKDEDESPEAEKKEE